MADKEDENDIDKEGFQMVKTKKEKKCKKKLNIRSIPSPSNSSL